MFPHFDDDFMAPFTSSSQSLLSEISPFSLNGHRNFRNGPDIFNLFFESMNNFVRQTAGVLMSDMDTNRSQHSFNYRNSSEPTNTSEHRIYHRRQRLQEIDANLLRPPPPPMSLGTSPRRAIHYLDCLPITTVRNRKIHSNIREGKQVQSNNNDNTLENVKACNISGVALEYFLRLDRKSSSQLYNLIPVQPFTVDSTGRMPECDICLSEYEVGHKLRHLPCGHSFHRECIDKWLVNSETCPKCRKNVVGTLRRLQTKYARSCSQSRAPFPLTSRETLSSACANTNSDTLAPVVRQRNSASIVHTRSSILRHQLAEQRRAAEALCQTPLGSIHSVTKTASNSSIKPLLKVVEELTIPATDISSTQTKEKAIEGTNTLFETNKLTDVVCEDEGNGKKGPGPMNEPRIKAVEAALRRFEHSRQASQNE